MEDRQQTTTYIIKIGKKLWFSSDKLRECRDKVKVLLKMNEIEGHLNDKVIIEKEVITIKTMNTYNDVNSTNLINDMF